MGKFVKYVAGICASSLPLPYVVEYKNALLILVIILFDKSPFYLYVMLLVDLT